MYQSRGESVCARLYGNNPWSDVIICTKKINLSRSDGSEGYLHWGDSPSLMIAVLACLTRSGDTGSPPAMKSFLKWEWRRLWTGGSGHKEIFFTDKHPTFKTQVWMRGRRVCPIKKWNCCLSSTKQALFFFLNLRQNVLSTPQKWRRTTSMSCGASLLVLVLL